MRKVILLFFLYHCCRSDKYEYGLFENFVVTKSIFIDELRLLVALRQLLGILSGKRDALIGKSLSPMQVIRDKLRDNLQSVNKLSSEFPFFPSDYKGALRGLMVLRETYDLPMADFVAGRVVLPSSSSSSAGLARVSFSSPHAFRAQDLANLASEAYDYQWFDAAVLFLREAFRLHDAGDDHVPAEHLEQMRALRPVYAQHHNQLLRKRRKQWGQGFKLLPYLVDDRSLERSRKQPKFVQGLNFSRSLADADEFIENEKKDEADRRICRRALVGEAVAEQQPQRCFLLHHGDPYLKLGPFKLEKVMAEPARMVLHDFLDESEIVWLLKYSEPMLSRTRAHTKSNEEIKKNDVEARKVRIVSKTVQTFIPDVTFAEEERYDENRDLMPLGDPYGFSVVNPILFALARKIEVATRLRVRGRFSSTQFQVTNYGLSGLCESHIDPHGYIEGMEVPDERASLHATGDMIATFMAWLNEVEAGGATVFDHVDFEQAVWPSRGSAALWVDVNRKGFREQRSSHMGCPVLKGSKWILNKWIYYFDQFLEYPCGLDEDDTFGAFTEHFT